MKPKVAEIGLEPMTFRLWAWQATNCSTPRYYKHRWMDSNQLSYICIALVVGLEPTTPWLTVKCSNQLNYTSKMNYLFLKPIPGAKALWCYNKIGKYLVSGMPWKRLVQETTPKYFLWWYAYIINKRYTTSPATTMILLARIL